VRKSSGAARKQKLMSLIGCKHVADPNNPNAPPQNGNQMLPQIVDDWMSAKFDDVLLRMLSRRPEQRPQPSSVLESAWLQETFRETDSSQTIEYECPMPGDLTAYVVFTFGLPLLALSCCGCCICCGMCCCACNTAQGGQSTGWIACLLALCVAGSGMSLGLWINGFLLYVLMLVSCGTCLFSGYHGTKCNSNSTSEADQHVAPTWKISLSCSTAYCFVSTLALFLQTAPLRQHVAYAKEMLNPIVSDLVEKELIPDPTDSKGLQMLQMLLGVFKTCIIWTMYPGISGFAIALFGLWRWRTHREKRIVEPGLEMQQT